MEIKIDITDWNEQYQEKLPDVNSHEQIIERAKEGVKPSEMGRHIIASRENGHAPKNIIKPVKMLLNIGAANSVSQLIARQYKESDLSNGKKVKVRSFTCATEGVEVREVVDSDSETGYQNAINYLLNVVPGYIYSRLAIIAENDGDVKKYGDALKALIDEIVDRLT